MSMSCGKHKRIDLTLAQKLEITDMASNMTQTELSQRFGCAVNHLEGSTPKRSAAENMTSDRKKKRTRKAEDVEKVHYTWFGDARARGAQITTLILEEKARQFATTLDKPDFKVTNGWLCRWKAGYGIKYKKAHDEKNYADLESADTWVDFYCAF